MWLVGWDKDVVRIFLTEAAEVDEQVVLIGHKEVNLVEDVGVCECGFGHGEEGLLYGEGFMRGEGGDQGFAEMSAHLVKVDGLIGRGCGAGNGGGCIGPFGFEGGAEEAVGGFGKRGERVLNVAGEGGVGGLEDGEMVEAAGDGEGGVLVACNCGGLALVGAAHEGCWVGLAVDGEALPQGGFDDDFGGGDLGIAREDVVDEIFGVPDGIRTRVTAVKGPFVVFCIGSAELGKTSKPSIIA